MLSMHLLRWFRLTPKPLRGLHSGEAAAHWAEARFPKGSQSVAAYIADLLCEQVGLKLAELEPQKTLAGDLRIDEETTELVMALEEDLGIQIPAADLAGLLLVADLVEYVRGRLRLSDGSAVDPS